MYLYILIGKEKKIFHRKLENSYAKMIIVSRKNVSNFLIFLDQVLSDQPNAALLSEGDSLEKLEM